MLIRNRLLLWMAALSMEAVFGAARPVAANTTDPAAFSDSEPMRMRINGLALAVRSAVVPLPRESIAQAVLAAWRDSGSEGLEFTPSDERTVLGRQIGPLHETLTLLKTHDPLRTAIVLATQDARQQLGTSPQPPFVMPRDMRIIETIEQIDGVGPGVTFRIDSSVSTRESIERLHSSMTSSGWISDSRTLSDKGPSMLTGSRGSQQIMATALRGAEFTRVVVQVTGRAP